MEARILRLTEEPPSTLGWSTPEAFILPKVGISALHSQIRSLFSILTAVVLCLGLLCATATLWLHARLKAAPTGISADQRQEATFLFTKYFVASTLALQQSDGELQSVAVAKQNTGGPVPAKVTAPTVRVPTTVKGASSAVSDSTDLLKPVAYTYISQDFNVYSHPGLDLVAPYGTPIFAAASGCILSAQMGWNGGYGDLIIEDIGNGYTTRYAHQERFADGIGAGVCVGAGDLLGYVGLTGHTTGPHLHFELRKDGKPVRPDFY